MPIDDPARLRAVLDQIANALQPAVVIIGELHRRSVTTVQDLGALDAALARVVGILRSVQAGRAE